MIIKTVNEEYITKDPGFSFFLGGGGNLVYIISVQHNDM